MPTTPDLEATTLTLLATLLPSEIVLSPVASRTAMAGPMRDVADVGVDMVFVQASGGVADWHNDGPMPTASVSVVVRGSRKRYEATRALALKVHDALHLCGRRVVGAVVIVDIRSTSALPVYMGPGDNDDELFVEAFDVVTEVLS